MSLLSTPKAILGGSLRLVRVPLDASLSVAGGLVGRGERRLRANQERERARLLREQSARLEQEGEAHLDQAAERARRENAKLDKTAQLKRLEAKEASLDAKEAAVSAEKEATRIRKAASKAKKVRKAK